MQVALSAPFWAWVALAALLLAVEVFSGTGWLLWPAASAAVVGLVALVLPLDPGPALALFAGLTIVSTLLARRFWPPKPDDGPDINDNVARLIGHQGRVAQAFADLSGRVSIDGKEWAADLEEGDDLPVGAAIEVTGVSGSRLRVRPAR